MNRLTKELKLLGFFCFKENELYMLDTGKYTSLVIEGYKNQMIFTIDTPFTNKLFITTTLIVSQLTEPI